MSLAAVLATANSMVWPAEWTRSIRRDVLEMNSDATLAASSRFVELIIDG